MKKKIMITGAAGMLGGALFSAYRKKHQCFSLDINLPQEYDNWVNCDLTDAPAVRQAFEKIKPDTVIHCAALVNVDACESSPALADKLHVGATKTLSDLCRLAQAKLVYISTDSVFDGKSKGLYTEEDPVGPLNIYAKTKLEGERAALRCENSLVLRTNIFGWTKESKSFAEWVLKCLREQKAMNMFTDVFYTPIATCKLAEIIEGALAKNLAGLYHAAGKDKISKYDFALKVARLGKLERGCVKAASLREAKFSATRPENMALDCSKLESALGRKMPEADDSIKTWLLSQPVRG